MISVDEALSHLFALTKPTGLEDVPLLEADGRVLGAPVQAKRSQPPFAVSSMDGYAIHDTDKTPGAALTLIGESAAGHPSIQSLGPGQTIRIFTGAVVPEGASHVVIQEQVSRDADTVILGPDLMQETNIRPAGGDFKAGDPLAAPRRLTPEDVALLASMNAPRIQVHRKPVVALISTGDELVMPGDTPRPDQIVASNTFGLYAMLKRLGAAPRLLPIAKDTENSLNLAFDLAQGADLIVTIGGASVGDHDIVAQVMAEAERSFYKIAMRPGKPLMAGRIGDAMMMGLPGNPVSAMVCGHVFLAPVIRAMQGLPAEPTPRQAAPLAIDISENGPREHYMRATLGPDGLTPSGQQDSSLLSVLSQSNVLAIRPPKDGPRRQGEMLDYIPLTANC